jgi:hypothetical protein
MSTAIPQHNVQTVFRHFAGSSHISVGVDDGDGVGESSCSKCGIMDSSDDVKSLFSFLED